MGSLLCVYEVPCEQEAARNHAFWNTAPLRK